MQISQKMENCDWIINNRNILEPIGCCNLLAYKADFSSVARENTSEEFKK